MSRMDHPPRTPPTKKHSLVLGLDQAQESSQWGAWYEMNDDERMCYRYTRMAFETFEQAAEVRDYGWISQETWKKWEAWVRIWKNTAYFRYMWDDTCPRFMQSFVRMVDAL